METFRDLKAETAEKVRKLLIQAEDPAATPDEAHAFTMKAQQLMTKYSIDLAMITDADKVDAVTQEGWVVVNPYAAHKITLVNTVARANDCRTICTDLGGGRKRIDVIGFPSDVEWVQTLSRSLEVQMASALAAAMTHKPADVHGRTYSVGFIQGFVTEIHLRLQEARRQAVAAAEKVRTEERAAVARAALESGLSANQAASIAPQSVAVVLVGKQAQVDEEFKVRHPRARTVRHSVRLGSWSGFAPGRAAGRRAALARGAIGGGRRSLSA